MSSDKSVNAPDAPCISPAFRRHARKCRICAHPRRRDIEHDFLRWLSPREIVFNYALDAPLQPTGRGRLSLYRHARAAGLYPRRGRNLLPVLEHFMERAEEVIPTASQIVQAVRLHARLDKNGRLLKPQCSKPAGAQQTRKTAASAKSGLAPSINLLTL